MALTSLGRRPAQYIRVLTAFVWGRIRVLCRREEPLRLEPELEPELRELLELADMLLCRECLSGMAVQVWLPCGSVESPNLNPALLTARRSEREPRPDGQAGFVAEECDTL